MSIPAVLILPFAVRALIRGWLGSRPAALRVAHELSGPSPPALEFTGPAHSAPINCQPCRSGSGSGHPEGRKRRMAQPLTRLAREGDPGCFWWGCCRRSNTPPACFLGKSAWSVRGRRPAPRRSAGRCGVRSESDPGRGSRLRNRARGVAATVLPATDSTTFGILQARNVLRHSERRNILWRWNPALHAATPSRRARSGSGDTATWI